MTALLQKQMIYAVRKAALPQVARAKSAGAYPSIRSYATAPEAPHFKDLPAAGHIRAVDAKAPLNDPLKDAKSSLDGSLPLKDSLAHEDWVMFRA